VIVIISLYYHCVVYVGDVQFIPLSVISLSGFLFLAITKSTLSLHATKEKTSLLDFHALNQYLGQLNEQERLALKQLQVAHGEVATTTTEAATLSHEEEERARETREAEEREERAKAVEREKGEFAEKYDSLEKQFQEMKEMKKIFEENNSRKIEALTRDNADSEIRLAELKGKVWRILT
jgi:hypothetical protein